MKPHPPTLTDVARCAKVAIMTASRALNGHPSVRKTSLARVQKAAAELGYKPSAFAKWLKNGVSDVVLLSVWQLQNPYFGRLAEALAEELNKHEMQPLLCCDQSRILELDRIMQTRGCILTNPQPKLIAALGTSKAVVSLRSNRQVRKVPDVGIDFAPAYTEITEKLLAHGVRRFGFCATSVGHESTWNGKFRFVEKVLSQHDLALNPTYNTPEETAAAFVTDQPEVVFCENDVMAVQVMWALTRVGIACPKEVIVVGCDGTTVLDGMWTLRVSCREIAQRAVALLKRRLAGEMTAVQEMVRPIIHAPLP